MISLIKRSHSQQMAHKNKKAHQPVSLAGGAREPKVGLRLKFQISYRQTGAPYNMRNKRMGNTASGNNSTYQQHLTGLHPRRQSQTQTRVPMMITPAKATCD
jgi:hypothetical protein